jgi:hypothetical protein
METLFRQQGECLLLSRQAWDSAYWRKKSDRQDLTMTHYGRRARLKRTSLRVFACDAAIAYASVHPKLFIPTGDNPEFLDFFRPSSGIRQLTVKKNATPVQRYAPVGPYKDWIWSGRTNIS